MDVIDLAIDTIKKGKQALIFVNTKRSAESVAEKIRDEVIKKDIIKPLNKLSEQILNVLEKPTKQCEKLSKCVKYGIAFHHSGLLQKQKNIIEDNFRNNKIRIICCTPTLAYGVDLPAFRSIIRDVKRYTQHGLTYIPVLDYMQMSGRAGRPGKDEKGEAIVIAKTDEEKERIYERYIKGEPEKIQSKLAVEPVLRTYILSLIASDIVKNQNQLNNFFKKTFWAFQFKDINKLKNIIQKMILLLNDFKFISIENNDFISADMINNNFNIKITRLGKRVAELYIDPLTANHIIKCIKKANKKTDDIAFLQMISHTLEMRPLLNIRSKEYDDIQEKSLEFDFLENEPNMYDIYYDDYLKSIKTALFFNDWINEIDEETLMEKYNIRPGEIRSKLEMADWLIYSSQEIIKIIGKIDILTQLMKLRARLKYGIKQELLPLIKFKNIGRVRARLLYRNNIRNVKDVKNVSYEKLSKIIGKNIAKSMKEQVGIKI